MKEYFESLLRLMVERKASDLHIKAKIHPVLRISDQLTFLKDMPEHTIDQLQKIAQSILSQEKWEYFQKENELDTAYSLDSVGRFRLNIFVQRGSIVIVARAISLKVPQFEELGMPSTVKNLADKSRGLVLVTGTTGSGKSTTLAALIHHINQTKSVNIITIEDPIEYLHQDRLSLVNQREIGLDTKNFATALRYLLRQDPDVILIGEIRDVSTMEIALSAADTGHLVFSTLHTTDARQTIERVVNFFPLDQSPHIRLNLALNLVGIVSQRLLRKKTGAGLIPAVEIMIMNERIRKAIAENKIYEITQYISEGEVYGMQTFNQSLYQMAKEGHIEEDVALAASSCPDELRMLLKGMMPSTMDSKTSKEITDSLRQQKRTQPMARQNFIAYPDEEEKQTFSDIPYSKNTTHKKIQKFISYPELDETSEMQKPAGIIANLKQELQIREREKNINWKDRQTNNQKGNFFLYLFVLLVVAFFLSFFSFFSCPRCKGDSSSQCTFCTEGKINFWKWIGSKLLK